MAARRSISPLPPNRNRLDPSYVGHRGSNTGLGGTTNPRKNSTDTGKALDPSDPSTWTTRHTSMSKPTRPEVTGTAGPEEAVYEPNPQQAGGDSSDDDGGLGHAYNLKGAVPTSPSKSIRKNSTDKQADGPGRKLSTTSEPKSPETKPSDPSDSHLSAMSPPRLYVTHSGDVTDDKSRRRLSDKSNSFSTVASESDDLNAVREGGQPQEHAVEMSDEEVHHETESEDEARGRKQEKVNASAEPKRASHSDIVKSMLGPSVSVIGPGGEKVSAKSGAQGTHTRNKSPAIGVNEENEEDLIAKAKTLGINVSPLDNKVKDRHVQMILRGNWVQMNEEAVAGNRTTRTYMTCSDLSLEAMYAMEWTVGTIMRDGDTLLVIYAIEDENAAAVKESATDAEKEALHAEGAQAGKEASDAMETLTKVTTLQGKDKYIPVTEAKSLTGSVDARNVSKNELERLKAIEEITTTFLRFVRKTSLQVRCMIEVIHCRSPKHLILGAIDEIEPTLTIVGTRGRSSLKGVLLGSFSNYLVTKSSSPVMVARKKLKKPRSQVKISSNKIRLSNNLMASTIGGKRKSLTQARID